jgi:hexosaminidase
MPTTVRTCVPCLALGCVLLLLALPTAYAVTPALIPQPVTMQLRSGIFTLCPTLTSASASIPALTRIVCDADSLVTGEYLSAALSKATGCQFSFDSDAAGQPIRNAILLTTNAALASLGPEGYELTVAPDSVVIRAPSQAGVFYGIQSLLQLLPAQAFSQTPVPGVSWTIPCVYIQDQPRFSWRGMMLDVVRHFFTKDEVKQVLDTMALHKMNTFHWHLVDDQGWRIQILKYPLLTDVGAWRPTIDYLMNPRASTAYNAQGQYGGFYTQDDIREVVAYAAARHITIVPEIEMPGHSTAGLAAYPQFGCDPGPFNMDVINYHIDVYSPGTEGTFDFLENVLAEVMGLFPGQYIHTGGDEVASTIWKTNAPDVAMMQSLGINPTNSTAVSQYQSWFTAQIANFVASKGRTLIGWTEIEYGGVLTNAVVMDWITGANSKAVATASAGQKVVMSPNTNSYINYYATTDRSVEPWFNSLSYLQLPGVYNFEPVPASLPSKYATNILGSQCNLWGEYVPSLKNVQFKMFPRVCAMAEVGWTPKTLKNYADFTNRWNFHQQRLAAAGINYDHFSLPLAGNWTSPQISTNPVTLAYDITGKVNRAGEIDVSYYYTSGRNALYLYSTSLLENGTVIDTDTHNGYTGSGNGGQTNSCYILFLPQYHPGSTYTIQSTVAGRGGTSSNGRISLPNWN